MTSKQGISAVELGRQLKLRQATAWTWLHKIRSALGLRACELLSGAVEVDETYEGGVEKGVPGRGAKTKTLVGAAVEVPPDDRGMGRARLRVLKHADTRSLKKFVGATIQPGSSVLTDGLPSYNAKSLSGMEHYAIVVKGSGLEAHEALPAVHRVFALLHRVLLGTHQGAVRRKHLDAYLREFEFRFNRRNSKSRGLLF